MKLKNVKLIARRPRNSPCVSLRYYSTRTGKNIHLFQPQLETEVCSTSCSFEEIFGEKYKEEKEDEAMKKLIESAKQKNTEIMNEQRKYAEELLKSILEKGTWIKVKD